jgi:hypothetical protein
MKDTYHMLKTCISYQLHLAMGAFQRGIRLFFFSFRPSIESSKTCGQLDCVVFAPSRGGHNASIDRRAFLYSILGRILPQNNSLICDLDLGRMIYAWSDMGNPRDWHTLYASAGSDLPFRCQDSNVGTTPRPWSARTKHLLFGIWLGIWKIANLE